MLQDNALYTAFEKSTSDVVDKCARLFSSEYGQWALESEALGFNPGKKIHLSSNLLCNICGVDNNCGVVTCMLDDHHIGHALFVRFKTTKDLEVCWITQLVVAKEYRNLGIATRLIRHAISSTTRYVGLTSSNPYGAKR